MGLCAERPDDDDQLRVGVPPPAPELPSFLTPELLVSLLLRTKVADIIQAMTGTPGIVVVKRKAEDDYDVKLVNAESLRAIPASGTGMQEAINFLIDYKLRAPVTNWAMLIIDETTDGLEFVYTAGNYLSI